MILNLNSTIASLTLDAVVPIATELIVPNLVLILLIPLTLVAIPLALVAISVSLLDMLPVFVETDVAVA